MELSKRKVVFTVCVLAVLATTLIIRINSIAVRQDDQKRLSVAEQFFQFGPRKPPASRSELEARAWQILREQLSSPYSPEKPSWDTRDWYTKCKVGLMHCDQGAESFLTNTVMDASGDTIGHNAAGDTLRTLSSSMRVPLQELIVSRGAFAGREPAQLASVLFNEKARESLQSIVDGWNQDSLSKVQLQPGSVLAKAIWNRVPMSPDGISKTPIWVYPHHSLHALAGDVAGQLTLSDFKQLKLDQNALYGDEACGNPTSVLSPNCFHSYLLNADSGLVQRAVGGIDSSSRVLFTFCERASCYFLLEGIHFMVRLDPSDPVYRDYAPWLFITFWWTGEDNRVLGDKPWKYYQMNVTQMGRDDMANVPATLRNICFNPYLEGPISNGAVSNCVSCHRFAELALGKNAKSVVQIGSGECFGLRPIAFAGRTGSGKECISESAYSRLGIASDLVWSLARLNKE